MDTNKRARRNAAARVRYAANPAYFRAKPKAWNAANKERIQANGNAWREANRERHRAYSKAWNVANRDRYRVNQVRAQSRRRARIAHVLSTLTAQEWEVILEAAGHACVYCGSGERLSMDHLTPISKGGPHTSENVAPACLPCNLSKGAKTVMEFLAEKSNGR